MPKDQVGASGAQGSNDLKAFMRIIPSGTIVVGGKTKLRASIILTPVGGPADFLESWPEQIASHFENHGWEIDLGITTNTASHGDSIEAQATALQTAFESDATKEKINDLWQATFLDAMELDTVPWKELKKKIDLSLSGQSMKAGSGLTGNSAKSADDINDLFQLAKVEKAFGKKGQIIVPYDPRQTKEIDSIIPNPHAALAFGLEMQRACELATSIAVAGGGETTHIVEEQNRIMALADALANTLSDDIGTEKLKLSDNPKKFDKDDPYDLNGLFRKKKIGDLESYQCEIGKHRTEANVLFGKYSSTSGGDEGSKLTDFSRFYHSEDLRENTTQNANITDNMKTFSFATWPQYMDDTGGSIREVQNAFDPAECDLEKAIEIYYTITSTPALARLFGLVIDVDIDLDTFLGKIAIDHDGSAYYLISANCGNLSQKTNWSFTNLENYTSKNEGNTCYSFWPASKEEYEMRDKSNPGQLNPIKLAPDNLDQYNGYLVMGTGFPEPGSSGGSTPAKCEMSTARFDLTSMDIRTATELENQRRAIRETTAHGLASRDDKTFRATDSTDMARNTTMQTAGIVLLDRGAQLSAIRKIASKHDLNQQKITSNDPHIGIDVSDMLFAADHQMGLNLYVGIPDADNYQTTIWRPLNNRKIELFTKDGDDVVKTALNILAGTKESPQRIDMDRSILGTQSRLIPNAATPTEKIWALGAGKKNVMKAEAIVDEAFAQWSGDPMGLDPILGLAEDGDFTNPEDFKNRTPDNLSYGRKLSLLDKAKYKENLTMPLRYGVPYRFAMTCVYSGGVSAPISLVAKIESRHGDIKLCYPPKPAGKNIDTYAPYFRFLRQHRIESPVVLLTEYDVKEHDSPTGPQEGSHLIIRSVSPGTKVKDKEEFEEYWGHKPKSTTRIILPPSCDFSEWIRNGIIDGENHDNVKKPKGVFKRYVFNTKSGIVPTCKNTFIKGPNNALFFDERKMNSYSEELDPLPDNEAVGDGVFVTRSKGRGYFVDPMAGTMAFSLRLPGKENYLIDARIINLFDKDKIRDVLPIKLIIKKPKKGSIDIADSGSLDERITIKAGRKQGDFHKVTIALLPGESYEVDFWCVPSIESLATDFSIIQSLALCAAKEVSDSKICNHKEITKFIENYTLAKMTDTKMQDYLKSVADKQAIPVILDKDNRCFVGPGNCVTPPKRTLVNVATEMHALMLLRPLGEISAPKTINITHAVNRPDESQKPYLGHDGCSPSYETTYEPEFFHTAKYDREGICADLKFKRPVSQEAVIQKLDPTDIATGSNEAILHGDISMNLHTSDGFELTARTVLPGSSIFDDVNRGRSLYHRQSGTWSKKQKSAENIFGFAVKGDRKVYHRTSEISLLKVENLPYTLENSGQSTFNGITDANNVSAFDLERFYYPAPDLDTTWRASHRHVFPDGKARLVEITPKIFSRTDKHMKTIRRTKSVRKDFFKYVEFLPAENMPEEHSVTIGPSILTILPATIRPAKCNLVKAPIPNISVSNFQQIDNSTTSKSVTTTFVHVREASIHIRLKRPFFSSGMFERVGIVTWPPKFLSSENGQPRDYIPVDDHVMDLSSFKDEDLGPGGIYISRMGADPIRGTYFDENTDDTGNLPGIFLEKKNFPDLSSNGPARYEPNVIMPVGTKEDTDSDAHLGQTLNVGLVHYEPLFDVDREEWFIDVKIDPGMLSDPFIRLGIVAYQPHTRSDLMVSRPDYQMAQIMPKRTISITRHEKYITIDIAGPASTGAKKITPWQDEANNSRPHMVANFFNETRSPNGNILREPVNICQSDGNFSSELTIISTVPANEGDHDSTWTIKIHKKGNADLNLDDDIYVYIEEVEKRRPSQYEIEPLNPNNIVENTNGGDSEKFAYSGPRFSARLKLNEFLEKLLKMEDA